MIHGVIRSKGAAMASAVLPLLVAGAAFAQHGEGAVEAGAEPAAHPSIMNVNPGLMIWTVVTFVVLLVVLRFTAWGPLQKSLAAREKRIQDAVLGAEKARQESEALLARHRKMIDEAIEEAHKIIDEGKADGLRLKHEIMGQARAEAEEHKARALREVGLATDQAKKELWLEATKLSTELAEKILRRTLDGADQKRLIEEVLQEYRAMGSQGTR